MKKLSLYISLLCLILTAGACKNKTGGPATASSELTDDALMDTVQRRTFGKVPSPTVDLPPNGIM